MEILKVLFTLLAVTAMFSFLYFLMRRMTRNFLSGLRSLGDHLIHSFFSGLSNMDARDDPHPKSLPNMENLILPQILKDFPRFDLAMEKNHIKDHLMEVYGNKHNFTVHNIALTEYRKSTVKKSVVFQAAVSWEQDRILQKKLEIALEFQCVKGKLNPAVNCPNCGATLGFYDLECKYCGTRINDKRDQEWSFSSIREIY